MSNISGTRVLWWITNRLSLALDADEREAVHGDLAEANSTALKSLEDVFGFVLRRQALLLKRPSTWLLLMFGVLPIGIVLSITAMKIAHETTVYVWLYADNWDWQLLRSAGFWREFIEILPGILQSYLMLACWSWTCGFFLVSLSNRTIHTHLWLNAAAFYIVVVSLAALGVPHLLQGPFIIYPARDFWWNTAAFQSATYRVFYPLLIQALFALAPAGYGMLLGRRSAWCSPLFRGVLWMFLIVALFSLGTDGLKCWQMSARAVANQSFSHLVLFLGSYMALPSLRLFAVFGPAGYLLTTASASLWQKRKRVSAIG